VIFPILCIYSLKFNPFLHQSLHFSGHFLPLQIRNQPLPKPFPTFPLSRKTTAGDFGQKTPGEVGFGFEEVGEATRNGG
jgi:hypothetical protein